MNREALNPKQLASLFALFLSGSYLGIAGSEAKQDVWIALLIAIVCTFPLLLIYARIATLHPGKHLFDILFDVFGKFLGGVVSLLFILFFFGLAAVTMFAHSEAMHILFLERTPLLVLMALLVIFTAWSLHAGLRSLGRIASLLLFFAVCLILGALLLSIPNMAVESIQPIGQQPTETILKNALRFWMYPLGESIVFVSLLGHMPKEHSKYKTIFWGGGIGMALLLVMLMQDLLVLGIPTYMESYFPTYNAVSVIHVGGFIQRVDVVFSFALFLGAFTKISLSLNAACQGCVTVTGIKNPLFVLLPLTALLCAAGYFLAKVNIRFFALLQDSLFYFLPLPFLLPLLIWIVSEIKKRKKTPTEQT